MVTGGRIEKTDALFRVFTRFDRNGDGLVDVNEFHAILQTLGEDSSDEVLSLEFAAIDTDSNGMVEFREFRDWWRDYK